MLFNNVAKVFSQATEAFSKLFKARYLKWVDSNSTLLTFESYYREYLRSCAHEKGVAPFWVGLWCRGAALRSAAAPNQVKLTV